MRDGGLTKPDSDLVKTLEIHIRQIGVTLTDVVDRFIHPVALIFLSGLEDVAAVHVTEQLVTGSVKEFFFRQMGLQFCGLRASAFGASGRNLKLSPIT